MTKDKYSVEDFQVHYQKSELEDQIITYNAYYGKEYDQPFLIDAEVELYGIFCMDKSLHPKSPNEDHHYEILNVVGEGCGTFGEDTTYSKIAAVEKELKFL